MGVSVNGGTPKELFIVENIIKMNGDWGYPYFKKPPYDIIATLYLTYICIYIYTYLDRHGM